MANQTIAKRATSAPRLSAELKQVYAQFPHAPRRVLMQLRRLIFTTAASDSSIGALTETLKWGEPAFLTQATKSGTTVRIGWKVKAPKDIALYVHCQTSLVETFRTLYRAEYGAGNSEELRFEGNRAVIVGIDRELPEEALKRMIHAALTYHLHKQK